MPLNLMFVAALLTVVWPLSMLVCAATDPFTIIQAQSNDVTSGCQKITGGMGYCKSGAYLGFKNLNFNKAPIAFQMQASFFNKPIAGRSVSLRLNSPTDPPFLTFDQFFSTLNWGDIVNVTQLIPTVQQPQGVKDLYFTFGATNAADLIMDLNWIRFIASDGYCPTLTPISPVPTAVNNCAQPAKIRCFFVNFPLGCYGPSYLSSLNPILGTTFA